MIKTNKIPIATFVKLILSAAFLFLNINNYSTFGQFVLVDKGNIAKIYLAKTEAAFVKLAVEDLVKDVEKISGRKLAVVSDLKSCGGNCIIIGTVINTEAAKTIGGYNKKVVQQLTGKWEAYKVFTTIKNKGATALLITGSDERGTMFGIYDFIEKQLGVDPLYFWKDKEPAKKASLVWDKINIEAGEPSFRYRGWFINDEDLLTEWMESGGVRNIKYPFYSQVVNAEAANHVFEAMVRLRMNMVIPASFLDIDNPPEARLADEAAKRGLFLSMHHVEPLGLSGFTYFNYWEKRGKKPLFSFYGNRKEITEVWKYYADKWAKYPNVIWQVGLRGVGDQPMWMADPGNPQSDADRGALISEAIQLQIAIVKQVEKNAKPAISATLWGEGSQFFREGHLKIPDGVISIFADNSPGWRWQKDFYETPRKPGEKYGVYYHHQLWGSGPHLAQGVPIQKTYQAFGQAIAKSSNEYAVMNVSNVREFVLNLHASSQMLYDYKSFTPGAFMQRWAKANFATGAAPALKAYEKYFQAFQQPDDYPLPFLLDGQIKNKGMELLNKLLLQIKDSAQFRLKEEKDNAIPPKHSWGANYIVDMRPPYNGLTEFASKLAIQQLAFEDVYKEAIAATKKMTVADQQFLQTNLISHTHIMLGLGQWASSIIKARDAYQLRNVPTTITHIEQALQGFTEIKKGLKINSKGKWEHWYRGDKKMNLASMEKLTADVLNELRQLINQ